MTPAADRAAIELLHDPARSNRAIAEAAGCEHHAVGRARARLEQAGAIEPAPVRTPRWPNGPRALGRGQQAVADLGPQATTRQIMDRAHVNRHSAWHARTHPRITPARAADAAAATDQLRVIKQETTIAVAEATTVMNTTIEWACCTAELAGGQLAHERSCPFRQR
jgi:hypothetical protein